MSKDYKEIASYAIITIFLLGLFFVVTWSIYENYIKSGFTGPVHRNSIRNYANFRNNQDILNYPLWKFHIKSSHNSYLGGWSQILSNSDPEATRKAIVDHGCRCIELDVSRSGSIKNVASTIGVFASDTPVVSHAGADNRVSLLSSHCEVIARNAFSNTDDPLIIFLEIAELRYTQYVRNIISVIRTHLGSRLYEHTFQKTGFDNYFPNVPIRRLIGKVCIVMNFFLTDNDRKDRNSAFANRTELFNSIVHATTDEPEPNGWFSPNRPLMKGFIASGERPVVYNQLTRVFPANAIGSANYNTLNWLNRGHSLVSINVQTSDNRAEYNNFFKDGSIIPKSYYVDRNNRVQNADWLSFGFIQEGIWFKNRDYGSAELHIIPINVWFSDDCSWTVRNRYRLVIQSDGNLVIYDRNRPVWHTNTSGNQGAMFIMQSDGNMVVYSRNMRALWNSETFGWPFTDGRFNHNGDLVLMNGQRIAKKIG